MSGKEAIIDKILSDARVKANSTLEEGNNKAQEELSLAQNDADIYKQKNMTESYAERDEIVRRRITVANLEVKKILLGAKKQVIDKAFDVAADEIKKDGAAYKKLLSRMLKYADDNDVVTLAKSDKDSVKKDWIISQAKAQGKTVTVSDKYGDFSGGLIISGAGSDKNLTLEVELATVRDAYEPTLADILFGE